MNFKALNQSRQHGLRAFCLINILQIEAFPQYYIFFAKYSQTFYYVSAHILLKLSRKVVYRYWQTFAKSGFPTWVGPSENIYFRVLLLPPSFVTDKVQNNEHYDISYVLIRTLSGLCQALDMLLKFIYSEKATKFSEISTVNLSYVVTVKHTVEVSQNIVAFSEYMNFKEKCTVLKVKPSRQKKFHIFLCFVLFFLSI